jgi:hypothetical protein
MADPIAAFSADQELPLDAPVAILLPIFQTADADNSFLSSEVRLLPLPPSPTGHRL